MRYVDDFFSVTRAGLAEPAMKIFARLVQVCLGASAITAHKLGHGSQLIVLGIEIAFKSTGLTLWPSEDKVDKWIHRITTALKQGKLSPGDASKLSGALQWATQAIFKKLGRAMIRPIIKRSYARWSKIDRELELALKWWLEVLQCCLRFVDSCPPFIPFLGLSACILFDAGKSACGSKCQRARYIYTPTPGAHPLELRQC